MKNYFESIEFKIPKRKIVKKVFWQLGSDNNISKEFAQPIFDIGIEKIDMAETLCYRNTRTITKQHILTLVIQGKMEVSFDEKKFNLKSGMIAFCPIGTLYRRIAEEPCCWVSIRLFDKPFWEPLKHNGAYVRNYESMDQFVLLLSRIFEACQEKTIKSRMNALEDARSLAVLLKREPRISGQKKYQNTELLEQLVSKIENEPEFSWTISRMAKIVNLSSRSLHRFFQREYGMGPMDFVINKRLDRALEMLIYTDDKIEAIASSVGYKSLYSFSNLFMRRIGIRPGEFRIKYSSEL